MSQTTIHHKVCRSS